MAMVDELRRRGWSVVGPAATLEEAQALVASGVRLDAAILDINLRGRWVHGLAGELKQPRRAVRRLHRLRAGRSRRPLRRRALIAKPITRRGSAPRSTTC